jgi:phosphoserine phosphatase RsbU/P
MAVPPLPRTPGRFFEAYTQGLTTVDLERLFTRDTPEAYRFFSRAIDFEQLKKLPWHRRTLAHARLFFLAFTLKLTPARRAIYGLSLVCILVGLVELFQKMHLLLVPHPVFATGTMWLVTGFLLVNLLVLLEVADRLTLKNDLEIAREIQQAMLPRGAFHMPGLEAFGMTRPANTVGGDFYDILPLPDGRVLLALGDVAGKGSPASLLMALLLAMMRTLVDEGLDGAALADRLNIQIVKHAPRSRFVTLFVGTLHPTTGEFVYVNAGQNPPLLRRLNGSYERLRAGDGAGNVRARDVFSGNDAPQRRRRHRDVQRRHHRGRRRRGTTVRRSRPAADPRWRHLGLGQGARLGDVRRRRATHRTAPPPRRPDDPRDSTPAAAAGGLVARP